MRSVVWARCSGPLQRKSCIEHVLTWQRSSCIARVAPSHLAFDLFLPTVHVKQKRGGKLKVMGGWS